MSDSRYTSKTDGKGKADLKMSSRTERVQKCSYNQSPTPGRDKRELHCPRDDASMTPTRFSILTKKIHRKKESQAQSAVALSPRLSTLEMAHSKALTPVTINDSPLSPPLHESPKLSPIRHLTKINSMKFRKKGITQRNDAVPSCTSNMTRLYNSAPTSPNSPAIDETQIQSLSPMIQDLLKLEHVTKSCNGIENIFLPSLAKPRATSFLTGREEIIRSSESEPTEWQLEIPCYVDVYLCAKLCQYLSDSHVNADDRSKRADLKTVDGRSKGDVLPMMLPADTIIECHREAVEDFRQRSNGTCASFEVRELFTSTCCDNLIEVLIVDFGHKFLCIFAGATNDKHGKMIGNHKTISLTDGSIAFENHYSIFAAMQSSLFARLDKLTDESPFCDVMFSGHNVDASISIIAAHTYANTRSTIRVSCLLLGATKISPTSAFRRNAHSTPNLNVCQLEYDNFASTRQTNLERLDIGHRLILIPLQGTRGWIVQAYRFGFISHPAGTTSQKQLSGLFILPHRKTNEVAEFVQTLEKIEESSWVERFFMDDCALLNVQENCRESYKIT